MSILSDELVAGHPVTGAYDADDELARAELYAVNVPDVQALSMHSLREWASVGERAFKITTGIADVGLTDQQRNLCILADKLLGTDDGTLDPSNAEHVTFVNELVAANVLSAADKTALIAKATALVSVVRKENLGHVAISDITKARV